MSVSARWGDGALSQHRMCYKRNKSTCLRIKQLVVRHQMLTSRDVLLVGRADGTFLCLVERERLGPLLRARVPFV